MGGIARTALEELINSCLGITVFSHTLRMSPNGAAGLNLEASMNGMHVLDVDDDPGQPGSGPGELGLQVNDTIVMMNGVQLHGSWDEVQRIFGEHFAEGVVLTVARRVGA